MRAGPRSQLRMLGEFGLIRQLHERYGRVPRSVRRGIGDDAAVVTWSRPRELLVTTDLLVEGVHFRTQTASWADIGYKAAVANLSDIAAMGGAPHYLLIALALPASRTVGEVRELYHGLMEASREAAVSLIGGDTSTSPRDIFLNITVIGSVRRGRALLRRGARAGDLLYVSGTLGDARAGLALLDGAAALRAPAASLPPVHRRYLLGRHRRPSPRLRLGRLLSDAGLATAAMDLSDGLGGDLRRLCEESGVGAEVDLLRLPCSPACRAFARATGQDPGRLALAGGEDYELLFTVRPADVPRLERRLAVLDCPVSCIGRITRPGTGVRVRDDRGDVGPLPAESFEHFRTEGT